MDVSNVDRAKLPAREQTVQFDESDAAFIRRLCRREGIGWIVRAGKPGQKEAGKAGDTAHTLVLYDNAIKLSRSAVGAVDYRPDATIGERDAITLLSTARQLVSGAIRRVSWDHKHGKTDRIQGPTRVDQGKAGNDLGQLLMDSRLDAPHIADSSAHYDRIGLARVKAHDARAARVDGASGVRNLVVGEWIEVTSGTRQVRLSKEDSRFAITHLHHRAENNLPKALHERAQALFTASRWLFDTPSQISVQLASQHRDTEVNLGFLTHPRTNGVGEARGEGAEVRTDAAAALRAAQGILLTTYARAQASGSHLDRDELIQLLGECTELFKSLGDYAGQHGGLAMDTTGQSAVASALKGWQAPGGEPLMAFGAQAGSVNVTPKTHVTYAGENIDQVAQQHLQLMSGQHLNASAGQGMNLFARGKGVQAIAGEGPMLLQAQADALTANAKKGVTISSNANEVLVTAPTIRLVAEDGSYIKIGGGVTLGTNGDINLLSASHKWGGPSTQQATKSAFNNAPTDQRFRLHYPAGPDGEKAAAANKPYRITLDDGRVIEGKSDANGLTEVVKDDAMRILKIDILKPTN